MVPGIVDALVVLDVSLRGMRGPAAGAGRQAQDVGETDDGVQRGPQFVAHARQEVRLRLVCRLGPQQRRLGGVGGILGALPCRAQRHIIAALPQRAPELIRIAMRGGLAHLATGSKSIHIGNPRTVRTTPPIIQTPNILLSIASLGDCRALLNCSPGGCHKSTGG